MSLLSNSASVSNYTYAVGPSTTSNSVSNTASIDIEILNATINFLKSNTPTYIKPGNTVTLSFNVTNHNPEAIKSVVIQDSIFTTLGVTVTQVSGGTVNNDNLTIDLPSGTLPSGGTAQATVTIHIADNAYPDANLYDTTATGSFVVETSPETTVTMTSKGHLEVNSAIITLTKTVFPSARTITAGNLLTFTIVFTNSGNVDATIALGKFIDTWPAGMLTNVTSLNNKFAIIGNTVSNVEDVIVPANTSRTLIYTGISVAL